MVNGINGFGAGMPPKMDPDVYARIYAAQNNITVEEAKEELKSKYGAPQQQSQFQGINFNNNIHNLGTDVFQSSQTRGVEGPQKEGDMRDPNREAEKYAMDKGISLEEAKAELKSKYGDPQQVQGAMDNGVTSSILENLRKFIGQW